MQGNQSPFDGCALFRKYRNEKAVGSLGLHMGSDRMLRPGRLDPSHEVLGWLPTWGRQGLFVGRDIGLGLGVPSVSRGRRTSPAWQPKQHNPEG